MKTFTPGQRIICEMDLCSDADCGGRVIRFFTAGNEYIVLGVTPRGNVSCSNDAGMEHFLGLDAWDDPSWSNHFRPAYVEAEFCLSEFQKVATAVRKLTDKQRVDLFGDFCRACGTPDPNCQCWNDE